MSDSVERRRMNVRSDDLCASTTSADINWSFANSKEIMQSAVSPVITSTNDTYFLVLLLANLINWFKAPVPTATASQHHSPDPTSADLLMSAQLIRTEHRRRLNLPALSSLRIRITIRGRSVPKAYKTFRDKTFRDKEDGWLTFSNYPC
jgi:hypothetical protein